MPIITQYLCTPEEIQRITGRKRTTSQIRWLEKHHWRYAVSFRGEIVIARSHMEAQLNPPITHEITHNTGQDAPDWSALDAHN